MAGIFYLRILFLCTMFALCLCPALSAQSRDRNILPVDEDYPVGRYLEYLEDQEGKLSIEEVSSAAMSRSFRLSRKEILNFGFTSSVYWVRFKIAPEKKPTEYLIEVAYPLIDQMTIYRSVNRKWESETLGDMLPFYFRDIAHRNITCRIMAPSDTASTFYLRFQTEGSMQIPLMIWHPKNFYEAAMDESLFFGMLYGTLILIMAYNGFICWILQKRAYLLYIFMILFSVMLLSTLNGHAFKYFWPDFTGWANQALPFFIGMFSALVALFTRNMIESRQYTAFFHTLLSALSISGLLLAGLSLLLSYNLCVRMAIFNGSVTAVAVFIASMLCRIKGNRHARYLVPASYLYLIGIFMVALKLLNVVENTFITAHGIELGAVFQAIFYSLALRDKYSVLQ